MSEKIIALTQNFQFFYSYIQHKYPDPDFVCDVYRVSAHHVVLVDFNPFCRVTDPLLFAWDELQVRLNPLQVRLNPVTGEAEPCYR